MFSNYNKYLVIKTSLLYVIFLFLITKLLKITKNSILG